MPLVPPRQGFWIIRSDKRTAKIVLVGIGNPLRGDDGFGPALIAALDGQVRAVCIDAGTAPESYAGKIIKENPDTVVFVDAADLDLALDSAARAFESWRHSSPMERSRILREIRALGYQGGRTICCGCDSGRIGEVCKLAELVRQRIAQQQAAQVIAQAE